MTSSSSRFKIAVPDLISNSYFPAIAATELGIFRDQGLDAEIQLIFPVSKAYEALRAGEVDCVAGSAHSALATFPEWRGVAAPWVDLGLKQLVVAAGLDEARDNITIAPVPNTGSPSVNFGLTAAKALEDRLIDGFWANGMGTEVAVRSGAGTVVLDIRRGDGPKECFNYTMASLAVTDEFLAQRPDDARRAVNAMEQTHAALKNDVSLAAQIGRKVFPEREASLIAVLIERDLPFYSTQITPEFVAAMNEFARQRGILQGDPIFSEVVGGIR